MFDDLFNTVGEFAEGAWESVSTGAQSALGDWAGSTAPAATTQAGEPANVNNASGTTTTGTTGTTTNYPKPPMLGLDNQTLLIGGGLLLVAVLLFK